MPRRRVLEGFLAVTDDRADLRARVVDDVSARVGGLDVLVERIELRRVGTLVFIVSLDDVRLRVRAVGAGPAAAMCVEARLLVLPVDCLERSLLLSLGASAGRRLRALRKLVYHKLAPFALLQLRGLSAGNERHQCAEPILRKHDDAAALVVSPDVGRDFALLHLCLRHRLSWNVGQFEALGNVARIHFYNSII